MSDVQVVLKTMIGNVLVFIVDNVAIENLLSGFEFLFAVTVHSGLVHVDNDEGVWEDTGLLHGKALGAGFGEARENEAFLLFLYGFDLLFNQVDNDLIFDERELFEIAFDLLSELKFFADLFFEKIPHRNGGKLVMISNLECKLSDLEARRPNKEDFFG